MVLDRFPVRGEGERLVIGGRETRYGWQGVAPAVHARGMGAHVGAEVGGAVPWVAGHGEGRALATHWARGRGRAWGARAARIPVGRCQGRGAGKACAGARGKFAPKSWCWARRVGSRADEGRGSTLFVEQILSEFTHVTSVKILVTLPQEPFYPDSSVQVQPFLAWSAPSALETVRADHATALVSERHRRPFALFTTL